MDKFLKKMKKSNSNNKTVRDIVKEIIREEYIYDKELDSYDLKTIKGLISKLSQAVKENNYINIH